jgi:hypothetical protein
MATVANIIGLILNLAGVVLLFIFGMPYRVRTGGNQVNWRTVRNPNIVKAETLYDRLGTLGLVLIVVGTLSQIIAALI